MSRRATDIAMTHGAPVKSLALGEFVARCPACTALPPFLAAFPPQVVRCPACRTLFMNPRPSQQDIARHYDAGLTYTAWAHDAGLRAAMWRRRMRLVPRRSKAGTLLDIGTGDGEFLNAAREAGYECTGTEISVTGARRAMEQGHRMLVGSLGDLDFGGDTFDVITAWHVFEHLPDPLTAAERVHALLKPDGVLLCAVPNESNRLIKSRLTRDPHPFGDGTFKPGAEIHLTYFQPATLRTLFRRAGFQVLGFGVDDVYVRRPLGKRLKTAAHRLVCGLSGWHAGLAMWIACRKSEDPSLRRAEAPSF